MFPDPAAPVFVPRSAVVAQHRRPLYLRRARTVRFNPYACPFRPRGACTGRFTGLTPVFRPRRHLNVHAPAFLPTWLPANDTEAIILARTLAMLDD